MTEDTPHIGTLGCLVALGIVIAFWGGAALLVYGGYRLMKLWA